MLTLEEVQARYCPRLHCQECNAVITDARLARVAWPNGEGPQVPLVLCGGESGCIGLPKYARWPWSGLVEHLVYTLQNCGLGDILAAGATDGI
jgi:hypothetical protein